MYLESSNRLPGGIRNLLIATVSVYVLQVLPYIQDYVLSFGALVPSLALKGQVWRLVSYMFLHSPQSAWHILFNMLALWMFGVEIEQMWGTRRFVWFYFIAGAGSGVVSLFLVFTGDIPVIGASGAILGILTVYAYYFPHRKLLLFFLFPVSTRVAVIIFGAISIFGAVQNTGGIAHLTHLGGIIVALVYLKYYNQVIQYVYHREALHAEKKMRQLAQQKMRNDRYFEEVIDPILKKISTQGIDSLSQQERNILKRHAGKE